MWDSNGWVSLFAGFIAAGIILVIAEQVYKLIIQENNKTRSQKSDLDFSSELYEEDLKVIQAYSEQIISFGKEKRIPKIFELNYSLVRINQAFIRITKSQYFDNSELKENILGLKNSFYLIYSDKLKERF